MSKEVKEYLDYLKANEYIWNYEKRDNYIVLRYGLSSVKDTETSVKYNDNLRVFIENIIVKADELEDDIRGSLVDEKDYYGYVTKEELDDRINEEREYLKGLAGFRILPIKRYSINYVEQLENGLMKALDELSQKSEDFDYYDKLRELTNFSNYQALDFLDMYSDNKGE